jgi:hypothetical protein
MRNAVNIAQLDSRNEKLLASCPRVGQKGVSFTADGSRPNFTLRWTQALKTRSITTETSHRASMDLGAHAGCKSNVCEI